MTRNTIRIEEPCIVGKTIHYKYEVTGPWTEAFNLGQNFYVEYDVNLANIPTGVALIPLLANILPMAWVYDALVEAPVCDSDFFSCLEDVKHGYEEMYPTLNFGGELKAAKLQDCSGRREGAICLFSGGVDAFNTLIQHIDEKPLLFTLRGSDVALADVKGWHNVEKHVETVSQTFDVKHLTAASSFRTFLNEGVLCKKVSSSGDNWWHGFQHGLGILGHTAPIAWSLGKRTVYIASSFTAEDKGKVTCASDPTIDNYVRFCGVSVVHDGYEFRRQDKVKNIVRFARNSGIPVKLRVCWESAGGSNCCRCEKCFRTFLAVYAEGANPKEYGFDQSDVARIGRWAKRTFPTMGTEDRLLQRYVPIQDAMRSNLSLSDVDEELLWFYEGDLSRLVHASLPKRVVREISRKIRTLLP